MLVKNDGNFVIAGVEVKPYWETEGSLSLSPPSQFIPSLLENNLLQVFSYLLIDKSFESYNNWIINDLNISITLNISTFDVSNMAWLNHPNSATEELSAPRSQITISINYATIQHSADSMLDTITRLRINGYRLSIETAETNIEELDKILHLPLDELRVSDMLVTQIGSNMEAEFNVSTLISMASKMGLSVCACGVESQKTLSFLYGCGCNSALGNYLGKELKAQQVEKYVREKSSFTTTIE